jgi:hypothetical protein
MKRSRPAAAVQSDDVRALDDALAVVLWLHV